MKYTMILLLFPALLCAQEYEFRREWDSVQVQIGEYSLPAAWTGGYVVTRPAFCDLDGDGDKDLFLGHSEGTIAYYENTGSNYFALMDTAWLEMEFGYYSSPFFLDIDGDGDFDLFISSGNQPASLWENIGNPLSPQYILAEEELRDNTGAIIDAFFGTWADIDGDGNLDFFVGDWDYGNIYYYHNEGSGWNYSLQLITTNLVGTGVGEWPTPCFCDLDSDGDFDLFIGNFNGNIWYYRNDGTPLQYNFTFISNNWLGIDVGDNSSPEFADMDGDGDYDLWVGRDVDGQGTENTPGDIFYYENIGTAQNPEFLLITANSLTIDAGLGCGPKFVDDDADGDLDLWYSNGQFLTLFRNIGTASTPQYSLFDDDILNSLPLGGLDLYDLDADEDQDLISSIGDYFTSEVNFYQNVGTLENPSFVFSFQIPMSFGLIGQVCIADMDADGDGDMVLGRYFGNLLYYENQGTAQNPQFVLQSENWQNIWGWSIWLADMDLDTDFDLLVHNPISSKVWLYENIGTPQSAQMVLADTSLYNLCLVGANNPRPVDLDMDEDLDYLVGNSDGGIYFFRNVTGEPPGIMPKVTAPYRGPVLTLGPNPANPSTWISFTLTAPQEATLAVYNILGAKITTLTSGPQKPGEHTYYWNASQNASGVYIIRLETPHHTSAQRVVVLR